ncbi:hypothetical protein Tco_1308787 [Tanacetum coccineum]
MLERGNYIPWKCKFKRFLDNKLKEGERMRNSNQNGPYVRQMIPDLDGVVNINGTVKQILEPLSKMIEGNKKQCIADVKVMNYLLQAIPNDIYNSVDACKNAKEMWERIKRLMFGSNVASHVRHSHLMDEFDKFAEKEGESLVSVYDRLTTLVNIMDHNNVRPILVSINTKFLNCLQPEWSKYVTMVRHNQTGETVSYDMLYDSLVQFEPHVLASKAKKAAKNYDPLALIAHSNASLSQSHAHSSYSPQPYYVIHPSSVVDFEDEYQGELQGYSQEDKLTTAMLLLARSITQKFSTPTNYRLRTSTNTRSQAMIQDGRVDMMILRMQGDKTGIKCLMQEMEMMTAIRLFSVFHELSQLWEREQMLLAMKDEAGSNLNNEENGYMLDTLYGEETMEELTALAVSEVNASSKVHEQMHHEKRKTIIQTSDDDQFDSNIISDDPYVENNGGTSDHYSNDHDEYNKIQMLAYDLAKKAFKERENRYLEDISNLEEKLSSHDRIVYKMGQSIQTIHMLGKIPNKVYDPFLKAGLGYKNLERLKKAIAAQPKMYDGEKLYSTKLVIDSPDSKKTL